MNEEPIRLLTTTALPTLRDWRARPGGEYLGRLLTPRHYNAAQETVDAGIPWAADCDGFGGIDEDRFAAMLDAIAGVPGALFVVVPDVFADADATLELWRAWAPRVRAAGHPPALVLQDGVELETVPWDEVGALFLGGTDEHRARPAVRAILEEARRRRLHVHVGRVSSDGGIARARELGADTVDGSKYARWRDVYLPGALILLRNLNAYRPLELELG